MSLIAGDKLGPYKILALIGKGGMGEVYRARDTKLKRDVALTVLPEAFARDPERMASRHSYAVTNDGQRFLVAATAGGEKTVPLTVVLNWQGGLKKYRRCLFSFCPVGR
jgi:serine/threonine protein kinase